MSDVPQTLALLALGQQIRGTMVSQVNRLSATLRLIPIKKGAGKNCAWDVEGDSEDAENYADGADAQNFTVDSESLATLPWARVRKSFKVSGTARRAARSNEAGPDGIRDLIAHHMLLQSGKIASKVNGQLFTGTGTNDQIAGFDLAIGDDTNVYAGIDRATNPYWRPFVIDPGAPTAPAFQQIRSDRTAIFKRCGENPDIALCAPEVFDTVGALFDPVRREVRMVTTPRGTISLEGGFTGVEFDGTVFIKDKDAPPGKIYYLNSNYIEVQYLPLETPTLAAMEGMGIDMNANDGYGMTPLGVKWEKLAKTGDSEKYMGITEIQLVVRRPNACGCRKNVLTA